MSGIQGPEPISARDFLIPSQLRVTPTPYSRVLLVGSCLTGELSRHFPGLMPQVDHDFVLFNNVADLPDRPPKPPQQYTVQLLQIPLRTLLTDEIIRFKELRDASRGDSVLDRALSTLDLMLDAGLKYHRDHGIPTVIANFVVPSTPIVAAITDQGTVGDISHIVRCLNEHLYRRVSKMRSAYVLDLDSLAGYLGKHSVLDDWYHLFSHNATFASEWTEGSRPPFFLSFERLSVSDFRRSAMVEFFELVCRQVDAIVRTHSQIDQVKLVVFDLDNTLWRGQIAEHYGDGVERPLCVGWPEGIAEAIHHLRARGLLVAISSKNDESIVTERWTRAHPFGWMTLADFVVRKINWQPKAVHIAEILAETGLTAKSTVFVDDNPVEREAVRTAFPEIRTLGDNPFLTRSILLRAPETQVSRITGESARRESMVRRQIDRERERATMSREAFLSGLNCTLAVDVVRADNGDRFARAFELINKTNQFNTTGRRWSVADFATLFQMSGFLLAFTAADRFTDYGLAGLVVVAQDRIEQMVMSCRILGLEIETAMLAVVISGMRSAHAGHVRSTVRATKENMVCRDVFAKVGFTLTKESDLASEYIYTSALAPPIPAHITVSREATTAKPPPHT
jgi:FkbH-like protein